MALHCLPGLFTVGKTPLACGCAEGDRPWPEREGSSHPLFLLPAFGRETTLQQPCAACRAVAKSGISGVARGSRPLPEREGSSLPPLSPPPQAANKDVATALRCLRQRRRKRQG
jgi:hypothetical protein